MNFSNLPKELTYAISKLKEKFLGALPSKSTVHEAVQDLYESVKYLSKSTYNLTQNLYSTYLKPTICEINDKISLGLKHTTQIVKDTYEGNMEFADLGKDLKNILSTLECFTKSSIEFLLNIYYQNSSQESAEGSLSPEENVPLNDVSPDDALSKILGEDSF